MLRPLQQVATAMFGLVLGLPALARAEADDYESSYAPPQAKLRSDFTLGLNLGFGVGSSRGYPNEASQIDNPRYLQELPLNAGSGISFWFGGALRDWFTIGLGLAMSGAKDAQRSAGFTAFIVHLEGYPLFSQGGAWRNLGLYSEIGAGGATIIEDDKVIADGGAISTVALGAVYEPIAFGAFRCGPTLSYSHQFSQSISQHFLLGGFRIAFYGGP